MLLTLVTPNKKLFVDLEVEEVQLPGHRGELTILEGHSPLITTLDVGVLKFKSKSEAVIKQYAISWGYCEVAGEQIKVLAETAEDFEAIDKARAEASLKKSEDILANSKDLSLDDSMKYMAKIKKAQNRLSH